LRVRVPSVTRPRLRRGEFQNPNPKFQKAELSQAIIGFGALGVWNFRRRSRGGMCVAWRGSMLNPASVVSKNAKDADFWLRLLNDETLSDCDGLEKIVIGCEIIAALDSVDLLAAA
jgi:hypothetical protein